MKNPRVAERTCLGCRTAQPQDELLRLVRSPDGEVIPDPQRRLPGRGVYLCYRSDCLVQAVRRGQFERGFRQPVKAVDLEAMHAQLLQQLQEQLQGLLSLARKAGQLLAGAGPLQERLGHEPFAVLVVAGDISEGRAAKLLHKARACGVDTIGYLTKEELGQLVGKGESSALGLRPGGLAKSFKQAFERYRQLAGEH